MRLGRNGHRFKWSTFLPILKIYWNWVILVQNTLLVKNSTIINTNLFTSIVYFFCYYSSTLSSLSEFSLQLPQLYITSQTTWQINWFSGCVPNSCVFLIHFLFQYCSTYFTNSCSWMPRFKLMWFIFVDRINIRSICVSLSSSS